MRKHHLSVMTLEEFEPNREFVGRNFNAGEVVQLVLRSPQTGRWLPFEYVQMVMMHELAHCKQMNHSRAFWAVRNEYATQLYGLWRDGYTGDGIWGRGANLSTGEWESNQVRADEILPEHLCGGTYRSRRRKRKAKPALTYQERKERRILKKFGKKGTALGADEEAKVKLEKGKKVQAKPRVAGSARGRELRAAAALARFEKQKVESEEEEEEVLIKGEDEETDSGSETEFEEGDVSASGAGVDAVDVDGSKLLDGKGRGMVKVCEDEDADDPDARNELSQLRDTFARRHGNAASSNVPASASRASLSSSPSTVLVKQEDADDEVIARHPEVNDVKGETLEQTSLHDLPLAPTSPQHSGNHPPKKENNIPNYLDRYNRPTDTSGQPAATFEQQQQPQTATGTCSMCSYANATTAITCSMCANVLDPDNMPNSWKCDSDSCKRAGYVNSGDCGVCGLCGKRKRST